MVQVGAYPTRSDAELAQTALAAAGIPSVVAADDAGGAYPFDLTGAARLLVDEGDAEDAAESCPSNPTQTERSNHDVDHRNRCRAAQARRGKPFLRSHDGPRCRHS